MCYLYCSYLLLTLSSPFSAYDHYPRIKKQIQRVVSQDNEADATGTAEEMGWRHRLAQRQVLPEHTARGDTGTATRGQSCLCNTAEQAEQGQHIRGSA